MSGDGIDQASGRGTGGDWGAGLFVWAVWLGMLIALCGYVRHYGLNVPMWDDWPMIPLMFGRQPLTLDWLWAVWADHRAPLTRLLIYMLAHLTDCDFRAGMWLSVFLLCALAAAMMLAARRLRGRTAFADIVFPLVLMHFGHSPHVLQSWNLQNTGVTAIIGALLLIIVASPGPLTLARGLGAAVCIWLMPGSGSTGIALLPAMALWLGTSGAWQWWANPPPDASSGLSRWRPRDTGGLCCLLGFASLILVPAYFQGWTRSSPTTDVWSAARGAVMFLSTAAGGSTVEFWPLTGIGFIVLGGVCCAIVAVAWRRIPAERPRLWAFICFLGGMCSVAWAAGWGRCGLPPDYCLNLRYSVLSAPALLAAYLLAVVYFSATLGRWIQMALAFMLCLLTPFNVRVAQEGADRILVGTQSFLADLQAGIPDAFLIERHHWMVPAWVDDDSIRRGEATVRAGMHELHQAGIGVWKELAMSPDFDEVPIKSSETSSIMPQTASAAGSHGNAVQWRFKLPGARRVIGIRLHCGLVFSDGAAKPVRCRATWGRGTEYHASPPANLVWLDPVPKEPTTPAALDGGVIRLFGGRDVVDIWVNEVIDGFTIEIEGPPCSLEIRKAAILVSPGEQNR